MTYKYIFNSTAKWIAYVWKENVFSVKDNEWIGWISENEVYSPSGEYLGFLEKFAEPNYYRVLRRVDDAPKFARMPPLPPSPPLPPVPPLPPLPPLLPAGYIDIFDES